MKDIKLENIKAQNKIFFLRYKKFPNILQDLHALYDQTTSWLSSEQISAPQILTQTSVVARNDEFGAASPVPAVIVHSSLIIYLLLKKNASRLKLPLIYKKNFSIASRRYIFFKTRCIFELPEEQKEVRTILPRPTNELEKTLPTEIAYADDVDFVGLNFVDTEEVQNTLHKYNLLVNIDKTEFTTLSRAGTEYKNTKKVGTLIGDEEDVERRKRLSNAALTKLLNVWIKGDKIKRKTKLKLYRSLVKSILVYNCGTWALTKSEEEKLNAFHRKQLRKVLNIKYPVKITNSSLYNKCEEHPLSIYILENRWRLFGHILRRNIEIPANKSMNSYFATHGKKFRGRPLTTLPVVLNKDLSRLQENTLQLTTREDLEHLRCIAQSRQQWRELSTGIRKAAEAPPSDD